MSTQTRTCEKCKASVPVDQVKFYPKTKDKEWLLCEKCCEDMKNRTKMTAMENEKYKPEPVKNVPDMRAPMQKGVPPAATDGDFKNMVCTKCNYSFRANMKNVTRYKKLTCPYCSRSEYLAEK